MPLIVDLLRHGEALPASAGGDGARPLSPAGERAIRELASVYAQRRWAIDRAFASPLKRAVDTARMVLDGAAPGVAPIITDALLPDRDPDEVIVELAAHDLTTGHVLVVGHQPLLGAVVGHLTGGREHSMSPAELIRILCDPPLAKACGRVVLERRP